LDILLLEFPASKYTQEGLLVYNLSLVKNEDLEFAISTLKDATKTRVVASGLVKFLDAQDDAIKPRTFVVERPNNLVEVHGRQLHPDAWGDRLIGHHDTPIRAGENRKIG
jgi:hypothetical protein